MQALDASEVRKRLAENGEFTVNDILDDEDDWEAMVDDAPTNANESAETSNTALSAEVKEPQEQEETETDSAFDTVTPTGCGVIVVKDGKVLVGTRKDNGLVCGPGGHIEIGNTGRCSHKRNKGRIWHQYSKYNSGNFDFWYVRTILSFAGFSMHRVLWKSNML